jgi:FADH2 O2-dependent halogenase
LSQTYDIAIVGSGFAGSLLAMIARRLGRTVLLLERGTHPRVVIGESSTPLSNLLLEELAIRYDLPEVKALTKWGTWQRAHPELACGLKRGFTFHHHNLSTPGPADPDRRDQLLVAASPHDDIADTHWYRADFDHFLLKKAVAMGVEYIDRIELFTAHEEGGELQLSGRQEGLPQSFRARFVVDATGPRGFLHRAMGLRDIGFTRFPNTKALYSHFTGVGRLGDGGFSRTTEPPPYPIDDAAVHHVFDGGWIWVLKFDNGVTSAGVVAREDVADELQIEQGALAWERLLGKIPALQEQFKQAKASQSFTYAPKLTFRSDRVAGANWALLPSAAGFVDPLLSTGFPLTLLGVTRLAQILSAEWGSKSIATSLEHYERLTQNELIATANLVGALYASMNDFPIFTALSMLYFAAASYSEIARRLNKAQLATSFLLHDHPAFGPACTRIYERVMSRRSPRESEAIAKTIFEVIDPIDVAGLGRQGRRNWYPVNAGDMLDSCWKVEATKGEAELLLRRCGFTL